MMFFLSNWKLFAGGAVIVAVAGGVLWLRYDAVQDERARVAAEAAKARIETLNTAREIENETRNDTDDALIDCLRGAGC